MYKPFGPFKFLILQPYSQSSSPVQSTLRAICLRHEWGWRNRTRSRGTRSFRDSRWCGQDGGDIDSRQSSAFTRWGRYLHLFQLKSEAGTGRVRFLVRKQWGFSSSALSALSRARLIWGFINFLRGHLRIHCSLHLFFKGASPTLSSFAAWVMGM